jgi:hypothetical protein
MIGVFFDQSSGISEDGAVGRHLEEASDVIELQFMLGVIIFADPLHYCLCLLDAILQQEIVNEGNENSALT